MSNRAELNAGISIKGQALSHLHKSNVQFWAPINCIELGCIELSRPH